MPWRGQCVEVFLPPTDVLGVLQVRASGLPASAPESVPAREKRCMTGDRDRLVMLMGVRDRGATVLAIALSAALPIGIIALASDFQHHPSTDRSEERRVGKECRSRW